MNPLRRTVLWVTGRDLMARSLPKTWESNFTINQSSEALWAMTFSADKYFQVLLRVAPNVLHRFAQRLVLGFRWRMLPAQEPTK